MHTDPDRPHPDDRDDDARAHESPQPPEPPEPPESRSAPTEHPHARGVVHAYQAYDPVNLPSPFAEAPDAVSGAFEHLLTYGSTRRLTPEELARAVRIDPAQIRGLGPGIDALIAMLEERRRRILETFDPEPARDAARSAYRRAVDAAEPPERFRRRFRRDATEGQLRDLERLWYEVGDEQSPFARQLLRAMEALGERFQVDRLASRWSFTGRTPLDVPAALAVKAELERIEALLEQLRKARETAQLAIIDMDALREFAEEEDRVEELGNLAALQRQIEELIRQGAEAQGIELGPEGYRLTPRAYRLFQSRLLAAIFEDLAASRSGRHETPVEGEGAVESAQTRPYAFGDSLASLDATQSILNALVRDPTKERSPDPRRRAVRLRPEDLEVHRTQIAPRCATAVILDMSGSMRYGGQYIAAKKMALALDGIVRREWPGDFLGFVEMYSLARVRHVSEIASLMPKPVSIHSPVVRLRADMSDPTIGEYDVPLHFTNIQRALQVARQLLSGQATPNRQIFLVTDGLPTAHFEGEQLYLLYPPDPRTEEATMREAQRCRRQGIVINIFLVPSFSQDEDDVRFAQRLVETTGGRAIFVGGRDLDRFVVWDYVAHRRLIFGAQ